MSNRANKGSSVNKVSGNLVPFIVAFLMFDLLAIFVFLIVSSTDSFSHSLSPSSPYYATVGYAETVNDAIEVYGRNTNKELDVKKCEKGICFKIEGDIEAFNAQSNTIITGDNECTDSWAVNLTTDVMFGGTNANVLDHINGRKAPEFLRLVQQNQKVVKGHNNALMFNSSEYMPLYNATGEQMYNAFYKDESKAFNNYAVKLEETNDAAAISAAIKESFSQPYKKPINQLLEKLSSQAKTAVPAAYTISTSIKGFDEKGDIDHNALLKNDLIKRSFNCTEKQETAS